MAAVSAAPVQMPVGHGHKNPQLRGFAPARERGGHGAKFRRSKLLYGAPVTFSERRVARFLAPNMCTQRIHLRILATSKRDAEAGSTGGNNIVENAFNWIAEVASAILNLGTEPPPQKLNPQPQPPTALGLLSDVSISSTQDSPPDSLTSSYSSPPRMPRSPSNFQRRSPIPSASISRQARQPGSFRPLMEPVAEVKKIAFKDVDIPTPLPPRLPSSFARKSPIDGLRVRGRASVLTVATEPAGSLVAPSGGAEATDAILAPAHDPLMSSPDVASADDGAAGIPKAVSESSADGITPSIESGAPFQEITDAAVPELLDQLVNSDLDATSAADGHPEVEMGTARPDAETVAQAVVNETSAPLSQESADSGAEALEQARVDAPLEAHDEVVDSGAVNGSFVVAEKTTAVAEESAIAQTAALEQETESDFRGHSLKEQENIKDDVSPLDPAATVDDSAQTVDSEFGGRASEVPASPRAPVDEAQVTAQIWATPGRDVVCEVVTPNTKVQVAEAHYEVERFVENFFAEGESLLNMNVAAPGSADRPVAADRSGDIAVSSLQADVTATELKALGPGADADAKTQRDGGKKVGKSSFVKKSPIQARRIRPSAPNASAVPSKPGHDLVRDSVQRDGDTGLDDMKSVNKSDGWTRHDEAKVSVAEELPVPSRNGYVSAVADVEQDLSREATAQEGVDTKAGGDARGAEAPDAMKRARKSAFVKKSPIPSRRNRASAPVSEAGTDMVDLESQPDEEKNTTSVQDARLEVPAQAAGPSLGRAGAAKARASSFVKKSPIPRKMKHVAASIEGSGAEQGLPMKVVNSNGNGQATESQDEATRARDSVFAKTSPIPQRRAQVPGSTPGDHAPVDEKKIKAQKLVQVLDKVLMKATEEEGPKKPKANASSAPSPTVDAEMYSARPSKPPQSDRRPLAPEQVVDFNLKGHVTEVQWEENVVRKRFFSKNSPVPPPTPKSQLASVDTDIAPEPAELPAGLGLEVLEQAFVRDPARSTFAKKSPIPAKRAPAPSASTASTGTERRQEPVAPAGRREGTPVGDIVAGIEGAKEVESSTLADRRKVGKKTGEPSFVKRSPIPARRKQVPIPIPETVPSTSSVDSLSDLVRGASSTEAPPPPFTQETVDAARLELLSQALTLGPTGEGRSHARGTAATEVVAAEVVFEHVEMEVVVRTGSAAAPLPAQLADLKLPELKNVAKARGLKGYSKLKKSELLELLTGTQP